MKEARQAEINSPTAVTSPANPIMMTFPSQKPASTREKQEDGHEANGTLTPKAAEPIEGASAIQTNAPYGDKEDAPAQTHCLKATATCGSGTCLSFLF